MDTQAVLRNILLVLQRDPTQYRCFGIYWWPLKAMLRGVFTQDQLKLLGPYEDADAAARAPRGLTPPQLIEQALLEYALNVRYGLGGDQVQDLDGDTVRMFDEDAGF